MNVQGHVDQTQAWRRPRASSCVECQRLRQRERRAKGRLTRVPKRTQARKLALARGDQHYRSEFPCRRGHRSLRLTASGQCLECQATIYARNVAEAAGAEAGARARE
jgi:hypothetical protein